MSYPHEFFQRWFPGEPCPTTGFHRLLEQHVPARGKILDFGCGANDLLTRYRSAERQVWGADFGAHPELKHPQWYRRLQNDGSIPFADETFDVVANHMVMEHVNEPARFLGEIARVLKPGGVAVAHSIHAGHYVTWIRRLFQLVPHEWVQRLVKKLYGRNERDTFPTHYRLNSRRVLGRVAQEIGLEWAEWEGYANQGYFVFSPLLFRAAVLCDAAIEKVSPGYGKIYFTVVLRKPLAAVSFLPHRVDCVTSPGLRYSKALEFGVPQPNA